METPLMTIDGKIVYVSEVEDKKQYPCPICEEGYALVTGKTADSGITLCYASSSGWNIMAYGYDAHSSGSENLVAPINFCPNCGRILRSFNEIKENKKEFWKNKS